MIEASPPKAIPSTLMHALQAAVGHENVITKREELYTYECDGLTLDTATPSAVVFVHSTEEVSKVIKACAKENWPFVARGAGTGLSGGAIPLNQAVVIELARMNQILELDFENRVALVEPGVVNLRLTKACTHENLHYAPDPSSQGSCTIGGNVAENSGGPHTLKYGVTTNHILGLEIVLPDGEIVELGGPEGSPPGFDLVGLFVGSEGTFGIATKVWVRLTPNPEAIKTLLAVFPTVDAASKCVSAIIARGIVPAALEMIDQTLIRAIEDWLHLGFPTDAGAILLIELDGLREGLGSLGERIEACARESGCLEVRTAQSEAERLLLWKARKQAFGAVGRISPSYYVQDGVIPRSKIAEVLARFKVISDKYGLVNANVFHAGDGNLHPLILFDERKPEEVERALSCNHEILMTVIEAGGMLSGEHGIGMEKLAFMPHVFNPDDLEGMHRIRDVFDPNTISNPNKAIPARHCWEVKGHSAPVMHPPQRRM